jgi:large subunit ribosomal protein L25
MSKNVDKTLRARSRDTSGKGAARQLRREGFVPAVVYGRDDETRSLALDAHDFDRLLSRIHVGTTVVELEVEGAEARQVLIREIQRHPVRRDVLHVDFFHIRADEKIAIEVPIHLIGESKGVDEGGILQQVRHQLEIECLPTEIPDEFTFDVSALEIGDSVHVGDLDTGNVVVLTDSDLTVCSVVPPTIEEEPEVEEEGLEPELVGEEGEEGEPAAEAEGEADEGGEDEEEG